MIINLGLDMNLEFSWTEIGTAYSGEGISSNLSFEAMNETNQFN